MWRIREFEELPSTNTLAKSMLATGEARHGDVLQAQHQTAGRGRLGNRGWEDVPGESLLMSVVLEHFPLTGAELAQYVGGLAVLDALRDLASARNLRVEFRLKWPNDILVNGRKICGLLSEAVWHANFLKGVVLGIGVNVRQTMFETLPTATSLLQLGIDTSLENVRTLILLSLQSQIESMSRMPEHLARMNVIGTLRQELAWLKDAGPLTLHGTQESHRGLAYQGITELAFLILAGKDGASFTTNSGSLEIPGYNDMVTEGAIIS
jgi:BirA family biotin operon repressor/biotin-[acetyl-CoA-carboxylase] ligase